MGEPSEGLLARGERLDGEPAHLSVVSYNILAPAFVRPIDRRTGAVQSFAAFEWAEPASEVLDWEAREPRLLAQLQSWGADVICLQEVQFEQDEGEPFRLPSWLMKLEGYAAQLPGQKSLEQMAERNERVLGDRVAIGCVVLYRTERLTKCSSGSGDPNTMVSISLEGKSGTALASLGRTCFCSIHLDARSEDKRVEQMRQCLARVRHFGTREMVLAGDLNTECLPGSCVAAFVDGTRKPTAEEMAKECASALRLANSEGDADGDVSVANQSPALPEPSKTQLEEWEVLWQSACKSTKEHRISLSHVPTGPTRAAYDHGKTTGPCVSWRLDHILYTSRSLKMTMRWTALEADPDAASTGLPNRANPSDHLPVSAVFQTSTVPVLGAAERQSFLDRLSALDSKQAGESFGLEQEIAKLEPAPAEAASEPAAESGKAKKNKKKRPRPSEETIAWIQEKRRRVKELKAKQVDERETFMRELSELEHDEMEKLLTPASWVEKGAHAAAGNNSK